jgi:hypothetical protein
MNNNVEVIAHAAHAYRIEKINEIQKKIERERDKRDALSRKYNKGIKIISVLDNVLVGFSMLLGVCGIGLLSTIIAAPVTIAMEAIAVGTGFLCIIGKQVNRKLEMKSGKHEKIKTLADCKLNAISDLVSKALKDNHVSDEEFSSIITELETFSSTKDEIRTRTKINIAEQENALQNILNVKRKRKT